LTSVGAAVSRGARLLAGGRAVASLAPGYYMEPTILEGAAHDDEISQQEQFGPITCLYRVAGFAEALALANATAFGLTGAIHTVLNDAIKAGGSSLRDHRQTSGELGYFQHSFKVYDREGEKCTTPRCGGTVKRFTQNGRSTFWCPKCQK